MPSSMILDLAQSIQTNTTIVQEYLSSEGLPNPSFDVDAHDISLIPPGAPKYVVTARVAVIDATAKLRNLMLGPRDYLITFSYNELLSLQAIYRFKLASAVPIHGEVTFEEIAKARGLYEPNVRRLLRHAINKRIFCEPRKGVVAHTATSKLLTEDEQLFDWVGATTDDLWQGTAQTINAMVKYPGSQEPQETGFAVANGTEKHAFEILGSHPERARRFGSAMKGLTEGTGYDLKFLVENYPWASLGHGTIVDIGGSTGFVCTRLAAEFPSLNFVVQDLPSVVTGAEEAIPSDLKDRVRLMAHDFLTEQAVKDADLYLFRWVLHNWSDKYCTIILRSLIPALKKGARILINDNVLPEPGEMSDWQEARLRSMDLTMLTMQNSRERDLDDWAELFRKADDRFRFLGGRQPEGSNLWILETIWDP